MIAPRTRREFLAEVGRGMLLVSVGHSVAAELGFAREFGADASNSLDFGQLEPLVRFMQETPIDKLLPGLAGKLNSGAELRQLVAAGALANARTFGGEDYVGFHTLMALAPSFHMSQELPAALKPLPIFKVLYRNTNRIQEKGGRRDEILHPVLPAAADEGRPTAELLREAVRNKDVATAERRFASIAQQGPEAALNDLLCAVEDTTEVHRVVLPYRAWDLLDLIGREQAHTLLRQSVRYCVKAESQQPIPKSNGVRTLLPVLLEEHHLLDKNPGSREGEDKWLSDFSETIFKSTPEEAARAAADALAEGFLPAHVGEAISLAANQLVLRDRGRSAREEVAGKPIGSVHGDSIGVHASDSACAWRNLARVSRPRNTFACLILGAYQVALDRTARGGDFLHWDPLPIRSHLEQIRAQDAATLLHDAEEAVRQNLQAHAMAIVHRYGELSHAPRPLFDLLLRFAVSEDGALHAEKYYQTVSEEFASTRPAFRWRHLTGLARVTASEFGRPAPGMIQARELLKC